MKKFLILVILIVAGYFIYENFIKEKEVVQINASYTKAREVVDIDAPAINPRDFAHYEGTVKNISEKALNNLVITYLIDAQESKGTINRLAPGEEINFKTGQIMLRHMDPAHYLKDVTYEVEE